MKACILSFLLLAAAPFASADELVVIVNSANPTASLSVDQIGSLFLSKTTAFPGGGLATPVELKEGSSLRNAFHDKVTKKDPAQLKAYWAKYTFTGKGQPPREFGSSAELKKFVANTPGAIGYVEKNVADASVKVVARISH